MEIVFPRHSAAPEDSLAFYGDAFYIPRLAAAAFGFLVIT
jgi:hypothetical protein